MKHLPDGPGRLLSQRDLLMRIKLTQDIKVYEQQLANLKSNGSYASFADIQTLKELIDSRREMLARLQ